MSKLKAETELIYPESDGKPMADNTLQYEWIVIIKENLELLLPHDFVAGDLLWYPVEGEPKTVTAPDVMVCLGRPKGYRGSYLQWKEENIAPQVVFEILSPGNSKPEMERKLAFYEKHGVAEYYLYDPLKNRLDGWKRGGNKLLKIVSMHNWVSPILGIKFELTATALSLYHPNGDRFLNHIELDQRVKQAELQLVQERQRAERLAAKLRALGIDPEDLA